MRNLAQTVRLAACLAALLSAAPAPAAEEEAFLAFQAATPGAFNYARLADIQVFLDASPTRCSVLLTDGQEIKAFQKCASITEHLGHAGFVSFPSAFGSVLLAPSFVTSLITTPNNGGCRLNLRNGRWVPVVLPCSAVRDALAQK